MAPDDGPPNGQVPEVLHHYEYSLATINGQVPPQVIASTSDAVGPVSYALVSGSIDADSVFAADVVGPTTPQSGATLRALRFRQRSTIRELRGTQSRDSDTNTDGTFTVTASRDTIVLSYSDGGKDAGALSPDGKSLVFRSLRADGSPLVYDYRLTQVTRSP